jgi:hypothetical protein
MAKKKLLILGSTDRIDLPEFNLFDIDCRIDTGAALSAIHCHHVQLTEKDGIAYISFQLLDPQHEEYQHLTYSTARFVEKKVKSSFGDYQLRYAIQTKIKIYGVEYDTEITLADRENMQYPMLVGRNLLRNGFLVNIRKRNLSWKKKQS